MDLIEFEDRFELHISSSLFNNNVTSNGKCYNYKRLVIPNLLMDYFRKKKDNLEYVYLYFWDESVFMSVEKLPDVKYSKRRVMKLGKKNSYYIYLNEKSLLKHDISIGDNVVFVIGSNKCLLGSECINIELLF